MPPPRRLRRALAPVIVAVELGLLAVFSAGVVLSVLGVPLDRRCRATRLTAMVVAYLGVELVTLAALWWTWVTRRLHPDEWWATTNCRLLSWALGRILAAAHRCLGFAIVTEDEHPGLAEGTRPVLVLARHGGLGDSFALVWLLLSRYGRTPRVVLKDVLQWEPLIDIALNRLGACFLPPKAYAGEVLADRLSRLASALRAGDALLLFPEGSNWTPRRRTRAIRRLRADRKARAARAAALMPHVLPPRPAGVFACLDARPDLDIVVAAHTGLDTLTTPGEAWRALPFDQPMTVRWWPASTPPLREAGRLEWLTTEWAVVDEWIDGHRAEDTPEPLGQ